MAPLIFKESYQGPTSIAVADFLAAKTALSKGRIKDAMNKGAVWLTRGKKRQRTRKASMLLQQRDYVELYYDEKLLTTVPPAALCLHDAVTYSVWNKPAGLLTQGTDYGDHCSLLRQAELNFQPRRPVFPIHRLDREASGLVLVAHARRSAAYFSELFRTGRITKKYRVTVLGDLSEKGSAGVITLPLDHKEAITEYTSTGYDPGANTSTAEVTIKTGRLHQIRRHFALIGHPIMGDPRYGNGNKNTSGLQLMAWMLSFVDPGTNKTVTFTSDDLASH